MSQIIKTEAVVLKAIKYRETSKILTFFTREHGKISGIMKGVRQSKTSYGTALEPMSHVSIVLYEKAGREVQTVTQCETVRQYRALYEDLDKMVIGLSMVELVRDVAHEQEQNIPLFTLLTSTLGALDAATRNSINLFYYFEVQLAGILGFTLTFDRCLSCGDPVVRGEGEAAKIEFHLERGAPLCERCHGVPGHKVGVSVQALRILTHMAQEEGMTQSTNIKIDRRAGQEIESLLWSFLRFHVSGVKPLKSRKVLQSLAGE